MKSFFSKKRVAPRMWDWWLVAAVLLVFIWAIAPQQLPVVAYKLSLVTLAAVVSFWLDRSMFKDAGTLRAFANGELNVRINLGWRMLVRALVFLGVVLGLSLGI